jgi:hypothetical protein|tara:strand:+ start:791 stop:1372 length:582 start_codon:yes stop_codon:yes gene_type:complete
MSASKALFGMVPLRKVGSNYNSTAQSQYDIANATASNIFHGDLVTIADGFITPIATTTDYAVGVFVGCEYTDPVSKQPTFSHYFPANTSSAIGNPVGFVVDDPYASFMIQADASVTAGDINSQNFEVTLGSGSTVTGNSGFGIKAASRATATKAVRPIALIDEPGNALTGTDGAFPKLEVKIVQHWMKRQATA